tara:strand:- start:541 stop:648 length:108 start_codon:yes stop_codon:yes gene_type:complete
MNNKLDYWIMYLEGDLSLKELLKFLKEKEDNTVWI